MIPGGPGWSRVWIGVGVPDRTEDPIVPAEETSARLRSMNKPNLTVRVIEGANHSMTPPNSQQPVDEYWNTMREWLRQLWKGS